MEMGISRLRRAPEAHAQYIALARQARNPLFYAKCGVADTLDGRFEMLVLHVFLALRGIEDVRRRRWILESLFDDLDRSLREMGVGDMGVAKRIKAMSQATFGRLTAYREAWEDEAALRAALRRNAYRGGPVSDEQLGRLVDHLRRAS